MSWHQDLSALLKHSALLADRAQGRMPEFAYLLRRYERGGFPSSSIPEAVTTSEPALPLPDGVDRSIANARRDVIRLAQQVHQSVSELDRRLNAWLIVAPALVDPEVPCVNESCGLVLEAGRRSGECGRCRQHRHRYGLAYPYRQDEGAA